MVDPEQTMEEASPAEAVEVPQASEELPAEAEIPSAEEMQDKIEEMENALGGTPQEEEGGMEVEANDASTPAADDDASVAAKRETDKLKAIMKTTRQSLKGAGKSIKKNVKALKKAGKKKMGKSKSGVPEEISTPKEVAEEEVDPAKADTDSESGEKEEEIKQLQKKIDDLQQDNLTLRGQVKELSGFEPEEPFDETVSDEERVVLEKKSYEDMDPEEKIMSLEFQVQKWQKLYLESNDIGASRVEKLEDGYDEASSIARGTNDEKKDDQEDRVLMLEYQLRESVKVLKTAQKKMVAQHEKEFHLQKTVDDLSDQILDLTTKLEDSKEANEELKCQLEAEQQAKAGVEASLTAERQRLDDFREDLGLEPMYKSEVVVADETLENQIQDDNSSFFCFAPAKTISQ